jgi:LysR family transcriptional regulator, hydrogen peroxide-inducible genes activator
MSIAEESRPMNLRDLKYLVALADTRHFGKAAERCFVSQPTLSAQIRKLEEYLGVPLVERQPRNVALTAAGEQVVERARRVIRDADDIIELAQLSRDPLAGKLRIGLIPTIGPYLLPRVMLKLRKALPKLQVLLFEYQTRVLLQKLRAGEIDMGVLALPIDEDGFETRELYREPFLVAMPADHRFTRQATVKPGDLNGEKLLLLEDGHCLRDQALEVCSLLQVEEETDFRATSLETLRQMVASGLGITLLPQLAAEGPFAAGKSLVTKPFREPQPGRMVGTVWRKSSTRIPAIEAVNSLLVRAGVAKP